MLHQIRLEHLLLIDIETASVVQNYDQLDNEYKEIWDKKANFFRDKMDSPEAFEQKAGLYAEFAKVVCISVAFFRIKDHENKKFELRMKSFCEEDEKELLANFGALLNNYYSHRKYIFAGHNVRDFDIPFLLRRMLINQIKLPYKLASNALKPRNFPTLDTFQIWKFGDHKNYTSLRLLIKLMGIEFPKIKSSGSDINDFYWNDKDLELIEAHCQNDVIGVAQLFLHLKGFPLLTPENIIIKDKQTTTDSDESDDELNFDIAAEEEDKYMEQSFPDEDTNENSKDNKKEIEEDESL